MQHLGLSSPCTLLVHCTISGLRAVLETIRPNPPYDPDTFLPVEWEYADDADFADEDEDNLREMQSIILLICH